MPTPKYAVHVDTAVYDKMYEHICFLAQVSVPAAQHLNLALDEAISYLKDSPTSCPLYIPRQTIDAELRYKLFGKRYRIVFEIIGR